MTKVNANHTIPARGAKDSLICDAYELPAIVDAVDNMWEAVRNNVSHAIKADPVEDGRFGPIAGLGWAIFELVKHARTMAATAEALELEEYARTTVRQRE